MRKHGLACDNLLSAEVVTEGGLVLTASQVENQDLFWGLRGGGGNFGVVTSFEFQLYPLDKILGGLLFYPLDVAKQVLLVYREVAAAAPDELGSALALATHPDAGQVVGVIVC
jgi:FAD/FMN-containing dehydrogenase